MPIVVDQIAISNLHSQKLRSLNTNYPSRMAGHVSGGFLTQALEDMANEQKKEQELMIQYSLTFLLVTIFFLLSPQRANAEDASWGYVGETGPEHWGELSPALSICSQGREQSPIDIETSMTVKAEPPALVLSWQAFAPAIMNSGHSLEISTQGKAGSAAVGNRTYRFVQFHFHHGSEHRINGKQMEAEIHFAHQSDAGDLLVIAVLVETGEENLELAGLLNNTPAKGQLVKPGIEISPESLLPPNLAGYRYKGPLTTPGCFEIITWHIARNTISLSTEQIQQLRST